jgi:general secretion pathway protein J
MGLARHPARLRGFTLVELLVALSVMALLALLSWRSIDGLYRTMDLTRQRADDLLRWQAALGQWNADLDALIDTEELRPMDFNGRTLRLTRRDSGESALESAGVRVVAWTLMNGTSGTRWTRWQSGPARQRDELAQAWQRAAEWAEASAGAVDPRDSALALGRFDRWQLFYHRGDSWSNPLSSVGNESPGTATPPQELPNGVRLVITPAPGEGLAGPLVRDWVRPTFQPGRP